MGTKRLSDARLLSYASGGLKQKIHVDGVKRKLKLSAASCGESSILRE
jgi:hypothetical protein